MNWTFEPDYTRTPVLDLDEHIEAAAECLHRARIAADLDAQRHYLTAARLRISALIAQYPEAPTHQKEQ